MEQKSVRVGIFYFLSFFLKKAKHMRFSKLVFFAGGMNEISKCATCFAERDNGGI